MRYLKYHLVVLCRTELRLTEVRLKTDLVLVQPCTFSAVQIRISTRSYEYEVVLRPLILKDLLVTRT